MNKFRYTHILATIFAACLLYACANVGRPDGGPIDEAPPRFLSSTPAYGAINTDKDRIVLHFDENVKVEDVAQNVVISPAQIKAPEIKASGKKVRVNLRDTLMPNTTYTVDFTDAIVDNNEGNPLGNFTYTFSTGDKIDTMEVAGYVLEAENLEPIKGMLVGLHSNLNDTAFTKVTFLRIGRTDSRGHFNIRGIAPGKYRIFGLQDGDQNYAFSQKSEKIAFEDSLIIPSSKPDTFQDTIWRDTITVDTVITRAYTHYYPDDIVLRAFKEVDPYQYLKKYSREVPNKLSMVFSAPNDSLPYLKGLNFDATNAFTIEKTAELDSLIYWVNDTVLAKKDTLLVEAHYMATDTLQKLVPTVDTLAFAIKSSYKRKMEKQRKEEEKARKKREKEGTDTIPPTIPTLKIKMEGASSMDVYGVLKIKFEEPVASFDSTKIKLMQQVDSLWKEVPHTVKTDEYHPMEYSLFTQWAPAGSYKLMVDSLAFKGIYGLGNKTDSATINVKNLDEYGEIYFNVTGAKASAFVQLLNNQDKVVRQRQVRDGKADFYYLKPGKYSARLIEDTNKNNKWDTGDYKTKTQPEKVYYYPQIVEIKALWELEQDWNIHTRPLFKQKHDEMKKQKPEDKKKKNQNKRRRR